MGLPITVWQQLKARTAKEFIRALRKDGWVKEKQRRKGKAPLAFVKEFHNGTVRRRVVIHYHPKKTYGVRLLKGLIRDIGWSEDDLKRLKLIKRQ